MSRRTDPLGKRALFGPAPSSGDEAVPSAGEPPTEVGDPFAPPPPAGRRALYSDAAARATGPAGTGAQGTAVAVVCRRCGRTTGLRPAALARTLVPSVWVPGATWGRYLRCPACHRFGWCRLRWGRPAA